MAILKPANTNSYIATNIDIFIAILDAKYAQNKDDFYELIAHSLNFPKYFGKNLDALDEMLSDLEWIEQSTIILIINKSKYFLKDEKDEYRSSILDIFSSEDAFRLNVIFN